MYKTAQALKQYVKKVDLVIEVVDARCPTISRNLDHRDLFATKNHVLILNKSDLADPHVTESWVRTFKRQGLCAFACCSKDYQQRQAILRFLTRIFNLRIAQKQHAGIIAPTWYAMVIGTPNTGKTQFINCLLGRRQNQVGNYPGVTKRLQWQQITPHLVLLDSPGVLPKLITSDDVGLVLVWSNLIKWHVLPKRAIFYGSLVAWKNFYPKFMVKIMKIINYEVSLQALKVITDSDFIAMFVARYQVFFTISRHQSLYDHFFTRLWNKFFVRYSWEQPEMLASDE